MGDPKEKEVKNKNPWIETLTSSVRKKEEVAVQFTERGKRGGEDVMWREGANKKW